MSKSIISFLPAFVFLIFVSLACNLDKNISQFNVNSNSGNSASNSKNKPTTDSKDKTDSTSGEEKVKPAAGKGNVQGKVLFNDQPVEGIEVKICENFSTILGISCKGKTVTAKTDKDGVFVLANLEPITYGGLTARVFKTNFFIYPQEGIMTPQKFNVEADQTIFAPDINLFKDDIKITNPKAGSKVDAKGVELKWDAYPDAAYYKVSLFPEARGVSPVSNERVNDSSYAITEDLPNGKYRIQVEAYNDNDKKLAESSKDIKFTVTGGTETEP